MTFCFQRFQHHLDIVKCKPLKQPILKRHNQSESVIKKGPTIAETYRPTELKQSLWEHTDKSLIVCEGPAASGVPGPSSFGSKVEQTPFCRTTAPPCRPDGAFTIALSFVGKPSKTVLSQ